MKKNAGDRCRRRIKYENVESHWNRVDVEKRRDACKTQVQKRREKQQRRIDAQTRRDLFHALHRGVKCIGYGSGGNVVTNEQARGKRREYKKPA